MSIKDTLRRLLSRNAHPAHLPYTPTPPARQQNASPSNQLPDNADTYTETEADIHSISGTNIGFGTKKIVHIDSRGQNKDFSQTQSHILGDGKLVSKIEDIAGVCRYCQNEAIQSLEANLISLEEAQIKSLYDISSASRCDICGTNTCTRHTRPIQMPDGSVQALCIDCQKQLREQILRQKVVGFLISPFMEDRNGE